VRLLRFWQGKGWEILVENHPIQAFDNEPETVMFKIF
jgi:hypothetical protein